VDRRLGRVVTVVALRGRRTHAGWSGVPQTGPWRNAANLRGWLLPDRTDVDGRWIVVDCASMGGSFDEVGVMASSFDDSRVCPVAPWRVLLPGDLGKRFAGFSIAVLRGEIPTAW
jgi:hypothetical protein